MAAACNPARQTYHVGWAFTARYAQHVSSMLQEVMMIGSFQRMRLEVYNHQVEVKDCLIDELRKGNRDLLWQSHSLEGRNKELHDDLLRSYHILDFKNDSLDSICTQLQNTQDELTLAQSYVYHLEAELVERDQQLEVSQS
jgi:hypothetical protein